MDKSLTYILIILMVVTIAAGLVYFPAYIYTTHVCLKAGYSKSIITVTTAYCYRIVDQTEYVVPFEVVE
jgi:hypothetical protein